MKAYKTVVRPAMMHGAETWVAKKAQKLDAAEMRMLRWMCGVTYMSRIRWATKVGEISKGQERGLKWYEHVMRRDEEYMEKRVVRMDAEGRRRKGRPKRRWIDTVNVD